jgi:flagellar motor switch protein FliN/FliY
MSTQQEMQIAQVAGGPLEREIAVLHDIPMTVSIEVGRLKLAVKEFLRLGPASVVDLKKIAGEPFEIAINGRVVARGEVVMVEQSSGVRIVEVLKPPVTS